VGVQARARNGSGDQEVVSEEVRSKEARSKEVRIKEECRQEVGCRCATQGTLSMAGALVLVAVLLGFPVIVGLGSVVLAALLGTSLDRDAVKRHAGSELLDLNR
jgi:hypothetical protein